VRQDQAIVALVPERVPAFELGIVVEVFGLARPELELPSWYSLTICAERPGAHESSTGGFGFHIEHGLEALRGADTVIVPGWSGEVSDALLAALPRDARYVSICSGAFLLAAAGLLDGREVATHWRYAERLARLYPRVRVNPDVLYVDEGDVLTSAGSAAGIDLCLHVVSCDHGRAIANRVARRLVIPPHRDGGQAQLIELPVPTAADDPIAGVMEWALERLHEPLALSTLAARAYMSVRTFTRRFQAATGTSPGRWLIEQRVRAALPLLEAEEPVEVVAARVGFGSAATFRHHFHAIMRTKPTAYRRAFAT
jgi:AraC family transcriptional activator FtrA